jgi:hypothetical protein
VARQQVRRLGCQTLAGYYFNFDLLLLLYLMPMCRVRLQVKPGGVAQLVSHRPVSGVPRAARSLVAAPKHEPFSFASRQLARHISCSGMSRAVQQQYLVATTAATAAAPGQLHMHWHALHVCMLLRFLVV